MRTSDGGLWRLTWELTNGQFRGRVVGHPKILASGKNFEQMSDRLHALISKKLQAGEWTADWDPPRPGKRGVLGHALNTHVSLGWDGRFIALQDPKVLFTSFCDTCGMVSGRRTKKPLRMFIEDSANLCGDFGTLPDGTSIFSRELAKAISEISIKPARVEFRPVERLGKGRKEYVEPVIVGRAKLAQPIALRCEPDLGWKCNACGFLYLYHDWSTHPSTTMRRQADLPKTNGAFWIANCYGRPEVCVPTDWWRKHRRAKFASGVLSSAIGVATDREIEEAPKLKLWSALGHKGSRRAGWLRKQQHLAEMYGVPFTPWEL